MIFGCVVLIDIPYSVVEGHYTTMCRSEDVTLFCVSVRVFVVAPIPFLLVCFVGRVSCVVVKFCLCVVLWRCCVTRASSET